jgi:flagellar M-ring protein FliF
VEVVNLRFAETPSTPITEPTGWLGALQFTKDDIMRAIEMVVMGLLGLVVLLMVVRPLVRRVLAPEAQAALPASGQLADALGAIENIKAEPSETARNDIAQIQGQVHAQSVQKVGELADRNPSEAVSIIRQWMSEPNPV